MNGLGQYIISVTGTALIGGFLCGLLNEGFGKSLMKLLCGWFLTVSVLNPLFKIKIPDLSQMIQTYTQEARIYSEKGSRMAEDALSDIIKQDAEAYIEEKAKQFHAELDAEVSVVDALPVSAVLSGKISPYGKEQMKKLLEVDLGITKEQQLWI